MAQRSLTLAVVLAGSFAVSNAAASESACSALADAAVPNATISSAQVVGAGQLEGLPQGYFPVDYSALPAFCRVIGSIAPTPASDIRFELWLPEQGWNGRFLQTGNGGAAGSIVHGSMAGPLARGYAVANTDTGHHGGGGDFSWATNQPERLEDYYFRAPHELTRVGKALTAMRYGRDAEKSYWLGCSTGGRQGLKEAQFFPEDFDAIIAGAPASNWAPLMGLSIHIQRNLGPEGLGIDKLALLKEAAIAACDATDGVRDLVISEPDTCSFDPASLQCPVEQKMAEASCLGEAEIAAARRIYSGLVASDGTVLIPGTGPASEPIWGAYAGSDFSIGTSFFRHVVTGDADWVPAEFDIDRDVKRASEQEAGRANAMDPDLSDFFNRGGKLITYHGTTDGLIPAGNSVNYHNSLIDELGEQVVADSARFYVVPGMDHCAGGNGAWQVDWLGAMEGWVERGEAPSYLNAMHPASPGPDGNTSGESFGRPVCPYPSVVGYRGGDARQAESFSCREL